MTPIKLPFLLIMMSIHTSVLSSKDSKLEFLTSKMSEMACRLDSFMSESEKEDHKCQHFERRTDQLCSLGSRVIKLENEIDDIKLLPKSHKIEESTGNSVSLIYEVQSQIQTLQNSFAQEISRIDELKETIQQTDRMSRVNPEAEVVIDSDMICGINTREFEHRPLTFHLSKINFNIFFKKPANASSTVINNVNYKIEYAVDGDLTTYHHSLQESYPWFFVDLEVPHYIWEIKITIREVTRADGIKIYVTNNLVFDSYGNPDLKQLPLFASKTGNSAGLTLTFTHPGGMCGRYVIISREIKTEYLLIFEIVGIGYAFK